MKIFMLNLGLLTVDLVEVKGRNETELKRYLAKKEIKEVRIGPSGDRLYFFGEKKEWGHSDEIEFNILSSTTFIDD